jgi:hypothetical protein
MVSAILACPFSHDQDSLAAWNGRRSSRVSIRSRNAGHCLGGAATDQFDLSYAAGQLGRKRHPSRSDKCDGLRWVRLGMGTHWLTVRPSDGAEFAARSYCDAA